MSVSGRRNGLILRERRPLFCSLTALYRTDIMNEFYLLACELRRVTAYRRFNDWFLCKVSSCSDTRGRLVGLTGFLAAVGDVALADKIYMQAVCSKGDKFVRRLRRGLTISFYAK